MIPTLIRSILDDHTVEPDRLEQALSAIMRGEVEEAQVGGLLVALATLSPDGALLAAAARSLRAHAVAIDPPRRRTLVDTCGTGGDGSGTFNISTAVAMVAAAAGAAVAKHGNRGVSSAVGSADVLEAAGCALELDPIQARELLDSIGFVFLFAPVFHPAMKHVAPVRRSLGIRTLFNLLGPLANPALAECQLVGVYDAGLTDVVCQALLELGSDEALVVHCAGLDEIGLHGPTVGHRLRAGAVSEVRIEPGDLGLERAPLEALQGGATAAENLAILRDALGADRGPRQDVVALNSAAVLDLAGLVSGLGEGLELAREQIRSGAALRVLDRYVESSRPAAGKGGA